MTSICLAVFPISIWPIRADFPVSFLASSMSSGAFLVITSLILASAAWRSGTVDLPHVLKALLAAAMASSRSSVVAMGTSQRGCSVRGSVTWWNLAAERFSPLMML